MTDTIVLAGDVEGLHFWDLQSSALLWTLKAHKTPVIGIFVDNSEIVTQSVVGELARWRLPPSEEVIEACRRQPRCAAVGE